MLLLLACNLLEVHPVNNCTHFLRQILHFDSRWTVRAEGSMPGAEGQRVTALQQEMMKWNINLHI